LKKNLPNECEFNILNELCLLLQPLKETSIVFSGSMYNTVSLLYPSIHYLINTCFNEIELKNELIVSLRDTLIESLRKRFRFVFSTDLFAAASFLNYNYRKFEFIHDSRERRNVLDKAKQYIINYHNVEQSTSFNSAEPVFSSSPLANITNSSQNVSALTNISSSSSNSSFSSLISKQKKPSFLSKIADKASNLIVSTNVSDIETEIINYQDNLFKIENNIEDEIDSCLSFYKINQNHFPLLTKIAKNIFCIPITSVPVEGLFSQSGLTMTDLRTRMTAKNLKACVFYKTNKKYFF
jgi:hypothetical protein